MSVKMSRLPEPTNLPTELRQYLNELIRALEANSTEISNAIDSIEVSVSSSGGGGGGGSWGSISGTLSDQTDLQTSLDTKVNSSDLSELVDDRVNSLLVAGGGIVLSYNDALNTLTIEAVAGW
jgi:hypothetical protein